MTELLRRTGWLLILGLVWAIPVMLFHEVGHLFFGAISGGGVSFSEYTGPLPTRVDLESPESLSNRQVRLTGGFVLIFPLIAGLGLLRRSFPLIFFGLGGSGISTHDLVVVQYPEAWRKTHCGRTNL